MIRLAHPAWLLLLLIVAARVFLLMRDRRQRFGAFPFSSLSLAPGKQTMRVRLAALPFLLEIAALTLFVIALSRPQRVERLSNSDRFGIDIVIALDASGSMAAEDFRPKNRFAVARELIGEFIERRQDDRIGIVTFGVRAATRVPVTYDREIARAALDRSQIGENGDGTAIGHAVATAVNRLRGSRARSRVIILVTDGVNNSGSIDPVVAATLAAKFGIKIYTVGVGSEGPVPLPVRRQNRFTGEVETVYTHIRGEIDEKTLATIAQTTGGAYFRATAPRAMADVLSRIDRLEKSRLNAPRTERVTELYPLPLTVALLALLAAFLGGETVWLKVPA
ncbi:MAG TPA: VWA domain-containing protein [Thermoanaerobaculia bacterium]|nr:VWA domain-containing protein [Thermoanaerobaculia bacterium]